MTRPSPDAVAAAQAAQKAWGIPASISLAQFALESGWGAHMPPGTNNPFGIKARRDAAGRYIDPIAGQALTREVVRGPDGKAHDVVIHAAFRRFDSLAQAFDYHAQLLAQGRPYAHARSLLPDVEAFADALTGVYATDPHYGAALTAIIRGSGLTQFDHMAAVAGKDPA